MARKPRSTAAVARTFAGIVDGRYQLGNKLTISNRLHVYKTGSGEDVTEHIEEVRDLTFYTHHSMDDFLGSEYETALAFDPHAADQQELPGMENNELRAQPIKAVTIDREERVYGLAIFGGKKDVALEPSQGLVLKQIEIASGHPIQLLAKWTAKGINWKQMPLAPLMELAHNSELSIQLTPFSQQQVDTAAKKARARKSHPGQTDLADELTTPDADQPAKPARKPAAKATSKGRAFEITGGNNGSQPS